MARQLDTLERVNASAVPRVAEFPRARHGWDRRYAVTMAGLDALAVAAAALVSQFVRFGAADATLKVAETRLPYELMAVVAVPAWVLAMLAGGGYEAKVIGVGNEEYRRVLTAAVHFVAATAFVAYVTGINVARGFVAVLIPLATVLTMAGRYVARRWLYRRRAAGSCLHRVLVVGTPDDARELAAHLTRYRFAGFAVVGACVPGDIERLRLGQDLAVPVVGGPDEVLDALARTGADVLAVTGPQVLPGSRLSRLAWQLEGSGVDLVVAPAVTDVAGPRVATRPVAGLPLLHVEEPRLSGLGRLAKEAFDRVAAAVLLLGLGPFLLAIAVVVAVTSPGGALFRQRRVGRQGREFTCVKFRTMVDGADGELETIIDLNEVDGVLFKVRNDPRITRVGRLLRRSSLDELPQLWNVLCGHMSIVGPRPPLPREVAQYGDDVRRRLLVKPGLTGLWQVSGRSDLPWDEAVRLDLYYVDNWSPLLDLVILARTVNAVIQGRGAY